MRREKRETTLDLNEPRRGSRKVTDLWGSSTLPPPVQPCNGPLGADKGPRHAAHLNLTWSRVVSQNGDNGHYAHYGCGSRKMTFFSFSLARLGDHNESQYPSFVIIWSDYGRIGKSIRVSYLVSCSSNSSPSRWNLLRTTARI